MEVWGYSPLLGMKLNPLLNALNELEDVCCKLERFKILPNDAPALYIL